MVIGRLLAMARSFDLGQNLLQKSGFLQQPQPARCMGRLKEFEQFIPNPFSADALNFRRQSLDTAKGFRLNLKFELGRQAYRAQQSQVVFSKPLGSRADCADQFCLEVLFAADPIEQFLLDWIIKQTVDGKVTSSRIRSGIAKADRLRMAAVAVIGFGAEGGHLELVVRLDNYQDPKFTANRDGPREQCFDLLR